MQILIIDDFLDVIKIKFDGTLVNFSLDDEQAIGEVYDCLDSCGPQDILVLYYPSFGNPLSEKDDRLLDLYYNIQSLYFHNKKFFPNGVVVQVFDETLRESLKRVGGSDTLLKV